MWNQIVHFADQYLAPYIHLLVPIAVLVVGWIAALLISGTFRRLLERTDLDNRLAHLIVGPEAGTRIPVEKWAGKGVFYVLMLFVAVAFFHTSGLTVITEPFNKVLVEIFAFAPQILSAALLLLLAWVLASLLRRITARLLTAIKADERVGESAGVDPPERLSLPQSVGNVVYWLVFLVFLPAVLDALKLQGLLQPIRDMLAEVLGFMPNIFAGFLILLVGWFVARIVQRVVTNLLAATNVDQVGERIGLQSVLGIQALSGLAGTVVYGLILILVAIAALDALQFDAISGPTRQMLTGIFNALPAIFTAGLILLIAYIVGRSLARLVTELLNQIGFDALLVRLGVGREPAAGQTTSAEVVSYLALLAILLFAAIEATAVLGFEGLAALLSQLTVFAGNMVLGLVIFGFGLYLANLFAGIVAQKSSTNSGLLSTAVRLATLTLTTSMALKQMGIADQIINMAFGLLLGAIAVAIALAFGLGSRDIAARQVEQWLQSLKKDGDSPTEEA